MNRAQLHHIAKSHYNNLYEQCKNVADNFNVEHIHQFRVAYKKLKSLLRLISLGNKKGDTIKISSKLKTAYTISGKIRDLQLQRQRIMKAVKREPEKPQAYLNLLQKEIRQLQKKLAGTLLEKSIAKRREKIPASVLDKIQLPKFKSFAQKKWANIHSIIEPGNLRDTDLHTIRKTLKDVFYNLKLYKGASHGKLERLAGNGKDEAYIHQLIADLGNFQDSCVSVALLKAYPPGDTNKDNPELMSRIKKTLMKDKQRLKRRLVQQLKNDFA